MINASAPNISHVSSLLVILALLVASLPGVAVGKSSSSSSGSIQVVNEGALIVDWGDGDIVFRTESGENAGVSSISGDIMYAQVPITIVDTRADGARQPYTIQLSMGDQTFGRYTIGSSNIIAVGVTGLPDSGLGSGFNGVTPFTSPVTVIRSTANPPGGTFNIIVAVEMHVPAGTVPGNYSGSLRLEVVPGTP